jgi:hypothetical protein
VLELFGQLVSAISLILDRTDRRRKLGMNVSFRTLAVDFYETAAGWRFVARELQNYVHSWRDADCPDYTSLGIIEGIVWKQSMIAQHQKQSRKLRKFFRLYAPEIDFTLTSLADRSRRDLAVMTEELLRVKEAGPETVDQYIREFDARTQEVLDGIETLRRFVVSTYPPC